MLPADDEGLCALPVLVQGLEQAKPEAFLDRCPTRSLVTYRARQQLATASASAPRQAAAPILGIRRNAKARRLSRGTILYRKARS